MCALFEQRENCKVKITYGGSGHLLRSIEVNKIGDIFFPGQRAYIDILQERGIVLDTRHVGYNQVAFFVKPGNPLNINAELTSLSDTGLRIVIGGPESGSIGRETKDFLTAAGMYETVVTQALFLSTDSKGLAQAIKRNDADLIVNWRATNFLPENLGQVELLPLPNSIAVKHPLVMGELKYSSRPELTKKLMALVASEEGQAIFRKYGFQD